MYKEVMHHLNPSGILVNEQFGFKKTHPTAKVHINLLMKYYGH
jgi:hypothetical protein